MKALILAVGAAALAAGIAPAQASIIDHRQQLRRSLLPVARERTIADLDALDDLRPRARRGGADDPTIGSRPRSIAGSCG